MSFVHFLASCLLDWLHFPEISPHVLRVDSHQQLLTYIDFALRKTERLSNTEVITKKGTPNEPAWI